MRNRAKTSSGPNASRIGNDPRSKFVATINVCAVNLLSRDVSELVIIDIILRLHLHPPDSTSERQGKIG